MKDLITLLRNFKKVAITGLVKDGNFHLTLGGKSYKVKFEARKTKEDRDFLLLKYLASGKRCILDVGANVGLSSLLLAENNKAKIFAFEASEESCILALEHARINGVSDRLTIVNSLLADRSGYSIPFYWEHTSAGASINEGYLGHRFAIQKSTLSIDDFVTHSKIAPDLIKMDIEGAEHLALSGALQTIKKFKPLVLVELHSFGNTTLQQNASNILSLVSAINYKMVYLKELREVKSGVDLNRGRCHVVLCDELFDFKKAFENFDTSHL
jgi:FkbM family methyltransferase